VCALIALAGAACDSLLEVELPGQVQAADLDDPRLAEALVRGVQGDFDCALGRYVWAGGLWGNDLYQADNFSRGRLTQLRSREVEIFDQNTCETNTFPQLYLPLQIARGQGENAISLIEGFEAASVPNRELLLATANAYTGYAYQMLGELMCELAFDGGPLATRADAMNRAVASFTSAIDHANTAGAAADAIRNMAYVGRARAHLNLGNTQDVLDDASQVDVGYVRYGFMDSALGRLYNRLYQYVTQSGGNSGSTVHPSWTNLMVGGVPDPRVPLEHYGLGVGFDGAAQVHRPRHGHPVRDLARGAAHDRGGRSLAGADDHQQPEDGSVRSRVRDRRDGVAASDDRGGDLGRDDRGGAGSGGLGGASA
jgi:hypothetical protein